MPTVQLGTTLAMDHLLSSSRSCKIRVLQTQATVRVPLRTARRPRLSDGLYTTKTRSVYHAELLTLGSYQTLIEHTRLENTKQHKVLCAPPCLEVLWQSCV